MAASSNRGSTALSDSLARYQSDAISDSLEFTADSPPSYVSGWTAQNSLKTRTALLAAAANTNDATIIVPTNSIGAGSNANRDPVSPFLKNNGAAFAWPSRMAPLFAARGIPATTSALMGGQAEADFTGHDNRVTSLGSWFNAGLGALGNNVFQCTTVAGAPVVFTTLDAVDGVKIIGVRGGSWVVGVSVDGGAQITTISAAAGSGAANLSALIPLGSVGVHAIKLTLISGTGFIIGLQCFNSTRRRVIIGKAGWFGSVTADFFTTWSANDGIKASACTIGLMSHIHNDVATAVPVATYSANMQLEINAQVAGGGEPWLVIEPWGATTGFQPYVAAIQQLAINNGCPLVDIASRIPLTSRPDCYDSGQTHLSDIGAQLMAQLIVDALLYKTGL